MTDVLIQMKPGAWRGIEFPVVERDFGFQHEQEHLRYIFRDEQLIESIGRENPTYRVEIPFREDIASGPFRNLYTRVYPKFLAACLDRTNGIYYDPAHGPIQCKLQALQETLTSQRRDGVDVLATWVVSPDEDGARTELGTLISTLEGAKGVAGAFDAEVGKLDEATKKRLADLNKGSGTAKISILDSATAAIDQVALAKDKTLAKVGQVVSKAERLDKSLGRLKEPSNTSLRNSARRLEQAARNLVDHATGSKVGPSRRVRTYVVPADIGRLALASKLGSSIQEFLGLNPPLARVHTVKAGTSVFYLQSGEFATLSSLAGAAAGTSVARGAVLGR